MNLISKKRAENFSDLFWLSDPILIDWMIYNLLPYGNSVCEVGAGTGNMMKAYEKNFSKIYLVEPCPNMFSILSSKNRLDNTFLINSTAEQTTLNSGTVDITLAKSSLHHFFDEESAFLEMYRISKRAIAILEVIAPDPICIPFLLNVVLRKEKGRSEQTIFTEEILLNKIIRYSSEYRSLHFDQYIDVKTWLEKSDLEDKEQADIYNYIYFQTSPLRQKMQIHLRNERLVMLRRMNLIIGVK